MYKSKWDKKNNTYAGIKITWENITHLQMLFLQAQYKYEEWKYENYQFEKYQEALAVPERIKKASEMRERYNDIIAELKETYKIVYYIRKKVASLYESSEEIKKEIDHKSENDIIFWINSFVWTSDPRLVSIGLPAKIPFVLFPKQEEIIKEVEQAYVHRTSLLIEKSRAQGLTELLCSFDVHHWLYRTGYVSGWGSRIKELVDKSGDPNTIFEKLRRIIYSLPPKMRPPGYEREGNKYDNSFRISNPVNGSSIIGEGGQNIGRGGRTSIYKIDEAAFIENPGKVDSALSHTTMCQIDISTPNGMNYFYDKRMSGRVKVITVGWWENPTQNPSWKEGKRNPESAWYKYQKETTDPAILAQEVDIDYNASVEGAFIPPEWVKAAVELSIPKGDTKVAGFDLAAGGKDEGVYVLREGPVVTKIVPLPAITPMEMTLSAVDESIKDDIATLVYDRNTLGEDVYPIVKQYKRDIPFSLIGIYGQSRASDDIIPEEGIRAKEKFRNKRAELWWNLRKRFEKTYLYREKREYFPPEELISIPNDTQLINQLSIPKLVRTVGGKIGVETKESMKARKVKSPDRADAVAYAFATQDDTAVIVPELGENMAKVVMKSRYVIDPYKPTDHYVSLYFTEDTQAYMLTFDYDIMSNILYVVSEKFYAFPDVKTIKEDVYATFNITEGFEVIKDWIVNEDVIRPLQEGKHTIWYDFRRAGVTLHPNYRDDYESALLMIRNMVSHLRLKFNFGLNDSLNQLRNWTIEKGRPKKGFYYALALAQFVLVLKKKMADLSPLE